MLAFGLMLMTLNKALCNFAAMDRLVEMPCGSVSLAFACLDSRAGVSGISLYLSFLLIFVTSL